VNGGVYVYRARKHSARWRIPLLSWHFAYVGQTSSFYHRHQQHMYGLGKYASNAKPWADLSPYVAFRIPLPNIPLLRKSVETLVILAVWPVYNHQKNRWNPRRISLSKQARQREWREATRLRVWSIRWYHVALLLTAAVAIRYWTGG
jgi:hypothetical protein